MPKYYDAINNPRSSKFPVTHAEKKLLSAYCPGIEFRSKFKFQCTNQSKTDNKTYWLYLEHRKDGQYPHGACARVKAGVFLSEDSKGKFEFKGKYALKLLNDKPVTTKKRKKVQACQYTLTSEQKQVVLRNNVEGSKILKRPFQYFEHNNKLYFLSEWQTGVELFDVVKNWNDGETDKTFKQRLRWADTLIRQVLALWAQGKIHGDIKVENIILLASLERLQLVDFDTVRSENEKSVGAAFNIFYTPIYLDEKKPTQMYAARKKAQKNPKLLIENPCDRQDDAYALGCVLTLLFEKELSRYGFKYHHFKKTTHASNQGIKNVMTNLSFTSCPEHIELIAKVIEQLMSDERNLRCEFMSRFERLLEQQKLEPSATFFKDPKIKTCHEFLQYLRPATNIHACFQNILTQYSTHLDKAKRFSWSSRHHIKSHAVKSALDDLKQDKTNYLTMISALEEAEIDQSRNWLFACCPWWRGNVTGATVLRNLKSLLTQIPQNQSLRLQKI